MKSFYSPRDTLLPGSKTLPGYYYTSEAVFAEELEKVFIERWLCVGREEKIPNPGDYFLQKIGVESVIVLRDQARQLHVYYNVCRHRGARMVSEESGQFSTCIQCPYHAWTYNLKGELIGAPQMEEVTGFNKADFPLAEIPLVLWEGFLFINLAVQPRPFLEDFAPLIGKLSAWRLPDLRVARVIEYQVKANWKLIVQNYSECYHCPLVHPNLNRITPYRSGKNDLYEGPFLGGYMVINHKEGSLTMSGGTCALPIGDITGEDLNRVYYYSIFPNMLLSLHPDYVMVHHLWPQAPDMTYVTCQWLFASQPEECGEYNPDDAFEFWDMTNRQDWRVCELSQLGVRSRAYNPAPYSGQESLLAAFDRELSRVLGRTE